MGDRVAPASTSEGASAGPGSTLPYRLAYLAFFAYLGIWARYFSLYMENVAGIPAHTIKSLFAVMVISGLVGAWIHGRIADVRRCRRRLLRLISFELACACGLWFAVRDEPTAYAVAVIQGLAAGACTPLLDASLLDWLGPRRKRYGRTRSFGTLGFGLAVTIAGLADEMDPILLAWALVGAAVLWHASTWALPDSQARRLAGIPPAPRVHLLSRGPLVWALVATVLQGFGFSCYEGTPAIDFKAAGAHGWTLRGLFTIDILSEILFLLLAPLVLRRVRAPVVAAAGMGVAGLRWILMSLGPPVPALFFTQALHGLAFGLWFAAIIQTVTSLVPPEARTRGQALISISFMLGLGGGLQLMGTWEDLGVDRATLSRLSGGAAFAGALLLLMAFRHTRALNVDEEILAPQGKLPAAPQD